MKNLKLGTVITLVFILAIFYGCDNSKSSSVSENPDIASVIEKLPQCLFNPISLNEIFLEDALLNCIHHSTYKTIYKGIKEIGTFHKTEERNWHNFKTIPKKIQVVNGQADVDYDVSYDDGEPGQQIPWTCKGTAKMVKKGSKWMIKETTITGT